MRIRRVQFVPSAVRCWSNAASQLLLGPAIFTALLVDSFSQRASGSARMTAMNAAIRHAEQALLRTLSVQYNRKGAPGRPSQERDHRVSPPVERAPSAARKKRRADLNQTKRYYHGQFPASVIDGAPTEEYCPAINEALTVEANGQRYTMEVEQHLENKIVRCVMMAGSDGLPS